MSQINIIIYFTGQLGYYGLVFSSLATFISWQIISLHLSFTFNLSFALIYAIFFLAPFGAIIGGTCGLISGAFTLIFFQNISNPRRYLLMMTTGNMILSFVITVIVIGSLHVTFAISDVPLVSHVSLLGGILATPLGAFGAYRTVKKYLNNKHLST